MEIKVLSTPRAMGEAAAGEIIALIEKKPDALICIAAGHTSLPVFDALIEKKADFSRAYFVSMDEWTGIEKEEAGSCSGFLERNFLSKTNFPQGHVTLFNGIYADAAAERARVTAFIKARGGIDYMLLGIGMNGHLALNEPGSGFDSRAREITLSNTTCEVAVKYFGGPVPAKKGITLGIADLMDARRVALCACGEHKNGILTQLLSVPIGDAFPASVIRKTKNAVLFADQAAMKGIQY